MMFRNAIVYRLKPARTVAERMTPLWISREALDAALTRRRLCAPGSQDTESRGWVSPGGDGAMVFEAAGFWLIELGIESKVLPSAVVRREADARAALIAEEQGYRPGRKQMKDLREQVMQELLPTALVRPSSIRAWISPAHGLLVVDAASRRRAEDVLEALRDALDTFPLQLVRTRVSAQRAMAEWLIDGVLPGPFSFEHDCELRSMTEEGASVRYARGELDFDQVREHLEAGKQPMQLRLTFDQSVSFTLTAGLELRRLEFLDIVGEQLQARFDEDGGDRLASELALLAGVQVNLIEALLLALGGEIVQGEDKAA